MFTVQYTRNKNKKQEKIFDINYTLFISHLHNSDDSGYVHICITEQIN